MPKTKEPFFQAFKKFITKGNVLDMAVGVVVGGSFSKIVNGLVNYIINPFVGIFIKGGSLDSIKTVITPEEVDAITGEIITKEVAILWGTWLQTILDFLIVSFCIFTMVRLIVRLRETLEANKIAEEEAKAKEAADKAAAEKAAADKAAAEKAAADKAAAEAAAALAAKQAELDASVLKQEALLSEIRDLLKNK